MYDVCYVYILILCASARVCMYESVNARTRVFGVTQHVCVVIQQVKNDKLAVHYI